MHSVSPQRLKFMCYSCSSELYRGNLKIALKKFQAVVLASIYTTLLFMESLVVRGFGVFVCFFQRVYSPNFVKSNNLGYQIILSSNTRTLLTEKHVL